jgi:CDP-glycerol glycerophosphotransferase
MQLPSRTQIRSTLVRARRAARSERLAWARHAKVDDAMVVYESFSGNGVLDNPEALFRALLASPDMAGLRHVWVLNGPAEGTAIHAEFATDPRVSFVQHESMAYYTAVASAKYIVNNATFPPQVGKREGQVYINTWHGTPLKAMGYDIPGGIAGTRNVIRNFAFADYLIAGNEATVDMYLHAYRMTNVFRGKIICEGTPRVDRQFVTPAEKDRLRAAIVGHGISVNEGQQIILFAPTWKGSFYAPTNNVRQLRHQIAALNEKIDTSRYRVLLKVHQRVYKFAAADPDLRDILIPNDMPTNDVLAATDVLLTDYSSIFIDFLATGRPVLFFTPDLDTYEDSRGLYLPLEQWPGPICANVVDLADRINALHTGRPDDPSVQFADNYAAAQKRYTSREDGGAAERIIDIVFRGQEEGYDVRSDFSDGRPSVLIYLGGMLPNGITTSALNILDNIDHSRVDVSVFYQHTTQRERARLIGLINPKVRHFPRTGGMNGHKLAVRRVMANGKVGGASSANVDRLMHDQVLVDEWNRCFGNSHFDHIVDFSGYSPLWMRILLQGKARTHSTWLHNDLRSDADRMVNGRTPHRNNLYVNFSLYKYIDRLVSVSSALAEVNRTKLAEYADAAKFTFAENAINYRRIRHLAFGITAHDERPSEPGLDVIPAAEPGLPARPASLPTVFSALLERFTLAEILDEGQRRSTIDRFLPAAQSGTHTFVTAGRLSPEKNHERLIRAFDQAHQRHPETRLLVLGSGPLRVPLRTLVGELGLDAAVRFTGQQANPYGVIAGSDCFVLSSDYEGQPMVLLEALVLGVPVVTTDFDSVRGVMPKGQGLIVARSVEALAQGMEESIQGNVPSAPFDYVAYNQNAVAQFYAAIGLDELASTT